MPNLVADEVVKRVREVALQSYLKTRQCEDLRQDIAAGLKFLGGPFSAGERVWYYHIESEKSQGEKKIHQKRRKVWWLDQG